METAPPRPTTLLEVTGMRCGGCAAAVEKHLRAFPGVTAARVNLLTAVAWVEHEATVVPEQLTDRLSASGFPAQLRADQHLVTAPIPQLPYPIGQLLLALLLLIGSVAGHFAQPATLPHAHHQSWESVGWHWALATIALWGPGRYILVDGWRGLRRGQPTMHSLVGLGALTAYVTSLVALLWPHLRWECFFDEPVMLVGAMLLGKTLEHSARHEAAKGLANLLALQPTAAQLLVADETELDQGKSPAPSDTATVPIGQLRRGDLVWVAASSTIPVDGLVVAGSSTVDEAMLTGESTPIFKTVGAGVTAGTHNQGAPLTLRVQNLGADTVLAQIITRVTEAQTQKPPLQSLADRVAGYFAYGVMGLAVITCGGWWWLGGSLLLGLKLGISVLVIACPCALGLATPTAILVGTGLALERGILVAGSAALAQLQEVKTVVFDKTGTLTQGRPQVVTYQLAGPAAEFWPLAAMAAAASPHPVSQGILAQVKALGYPIAPLADSHQEIGAGIVATSQGGHRVHLGRAEWLQEQGIPTPEVELAGSIVQVAIDHQWAGVIATQDPLRPAARATLDYLRGRGLEVVMITGDRPQVAAELAATLGIGTYYAGVSPAGKVELVAQLQQQGPVAVIGDGLNDAPALAQAQVGIAMGSGLAATVAAADMVLLHDRLENISTLWQLAQGIDRKIQQNLFWALAYNVLAIPVAAGALSVWHLTLTPAWAGALMASSSVSVVVNSLALRWQFRPNSTAS